MKSASDRRESGFALLLVFAIAAGIAIALYKELPRFAFEAQRSQEELLIERGEQYKRGIQLYFRKTKRYPPNMEALENTNNIRFLRKRYKDPITDKEEWRVIHVGPGGVFTDSLTQKPATDKDKDKDKDKNKTPGSIGSIGEAPQIGSAMQPGNQTDPPGPRLRASEQRPRYSQGATPSYGRPGVPESSDFPSPPPGNPNPRYPGQTGVELPSPPQPTTGYPVQYTGVPYPAQQTAPNAPPPHIGQTYASGGAAGAPTAPPPGQPAPNQPAQIQPYPSPAMPGIPGLPGVPNPQPGDPNPVVPGQPYYPLPGQASPGHAYPGQQPIPGLPYPAPYNPGQAAPGQQNPPTQQPSQPTGSIAGGPSLGSSAATPNPQANPVTPPYPYQQPATESGAQPPFREQRQRTPPRPAPNPGARGINRERQGAFSNFGRPGAPGGPQGGVGGIAGVASTSEKQAIKIYAEHDKYNEWEFIYDFGKDKTIVGAAGNMGTQGAVAGAGGREGFGGESGFGASGFSAGGFGGRGGRSHRPPTSARGGYPTQQGGFGSPGGFSSPYPAPRQTIPTSNNSNSIGSGFGGSIGSGLGSPFGSQPGAPPSQSPRPRPNRLP